MQTHATVLLCLSACLTGCASSLVPPSPTDARAQVMATERAFAQTMADRDHQAFATFISADAIFFSGPTPLRGKQSVVDHWARFYTAPAAPFSWEPKEVAVLDSGELALSTGPVWDAAGKQIATFTSIWRRESPNTWRIVFDKGNDSCKCAPP